MSNITVFENKDGYLVVDSRLIAEELGIEHESFVKTIDRYKTQTEQAFGILRFEVGEIKGRGQPEKYILLTEEQATFLMTLSRNTPEVVKCKQVLVLKFSEAKKLLKRQGYQPPQHTSVYIQRLENSRDHKIAYDLWSTFKEGAEVLLLVEKDFRVPVGQMDLCDGSIGKHWSSYRKDKEWIVDSSTYIHKFRDQRGEIECRAYHLSELPYFRQWLNEEYIPSYLPKYLVDKFGKRAVLQIYSEQGQINEHIERLTNEKRVTTIQDELYLMFLAAREAIQTRKYLE